MHRLLLALSEAMQDKKLLSLTLPAARDLSLIHI